MIYHSLLGESGARVTMAPHSETQPGRDHESDHSASVGEDVVIFLFMGLSRQYFSWESVRNRILFFDESVAVCL